MPPPPVVVSFRDRARLTPQTNHNESGSVLPEEDIKE